MATIHSLPKELRPFLTVNLDLDSLMAFFLTCKAFYKLYPKQVNVCFEVWEGDQNYETFIATATVCFGDARPTLANELFAHALYDDWKSCYTCWIATLDTKTLMSCRHEIWMGNVPINMDEDKKEKELALSKEFRYRYNDGSCRCYMAITPSMNRRMMDEHIRTACEIRVINVGNMITTNLLQPTQEEIDLAFATNMAYHIYRPESLECSRLTAVYSERKQFMCIADCNYYNTSKEVLDAAGNLYCIELNTNANVEEINDLNSDFIATMQRLGDLLL